MLVPEGPFSSTTATVCRATAKGNDDYVVIDDFCKDHHGVKAWAWRNGKLLGSKYNGRGNNKSVIWDPYRNDNNVEKGDYVGLKVMYRRWPVRCSLSGLHRGDEAQC